MIRSSISGAQSKKCPSTEQRMKSSRTCTCFQAAGKMSTTKRKSYHPCLPSKLQNDNGARQMKRGRIIRNGIISNHYNSFFIEIQRSCSSKIKKKIAKKEEEHRVKMRIRRYRLPCNDAFFHCCCFTSEFSFLLFGSSFLLLSLK